jgi:hypothetical protein
MEESRTMKEQLRKFGTLILILALCLTSIGTTKVQAASKPSRPSVSLVKRSKTQAKIKIKKRGKATGYQIAVKTSKKARYRIVMPTRKRTVVLRKLKASKVYYVKVRAFRTKGYRIVHGKFSKPIKIGKYKKTVKKPKSKPKATATPEPTVTPEATQIPEPTVTPSETPSDAPAPSSTPSEAPSDAPAPPATAAQ